MICTSSTYFWDITLEESVSEKTVDLLNLDVFWRETLRETKKRMPGYFPAHAVD